MKKLFLFLLPLLCLQGCIIEINEDDDDYDNCVDGYGPIEYRELFIPFFDGISLDIPVDLVLRGGPEQRVFAEGYDNVIRSIDLDVRNGIWEIEFDECVRDIDRLTIYVTTPVLTYLRINGSGLAYSENFLVVDDIDLRINGSGDITLEGLADELDLNTSGSGDLRAFGLDTRRADIDIYGSGDAEVFVRDFLRVRISGSGDVLYRGRPSLDINTSGSGSVIDAN